MRSRNNGIEIVFFVGIGFAVLALWWLSNALALDMLTTLKEVIGLTIVIGGYLWILIEFEISLKYSFLFFLSLVWFTLTPALNFYAYPNAGNPMFEKYILDGSAWYGSPYWQIGISVALIIAGALQNWYKD